MEGYSWGKGEEWDGVNGRRENSAKKINSRETERMERGVSERNMRENGKWGVEKGQLELSDWGQTWLEGSNCEMRETGVTVSVCLCLPAFFSPLFFFFKTLLLLSIFFLSNAYSHPPLHLSPLFSLQLFLQHLTACLFQFLVSIHRSIQLFYLSIYQSVCLSAHVCEHFDGITLLIFPAHPSLRWPPCFPPSTSPVHLNVTN